MAEENNTQTRTARTFAALRAGLDSIISFLSDYFAPLVSLITFAILATICWIYISKWMGSSGGVNSPMFNQGDIVLTVLFCCIFFGIIIWFLLVFSGKDVTDIGLGRIIVFCYVFTWIALVCSILPFIAFPMSDNITKFMTRSPIGIVKGCSIKPTYEKGNVPGEIQCDQQTDQWLVNVGGTVTPADGGVSTDSWIQVRVQGGLVVPLYFVVLALVGAAVSMTRRVPEYQARTCSASTKPLTNGEAREFLVLQIMQVVSAPLIAITAYYLIDPTSRASTVALGFTSGFASETILLYIRALSTKLQPSPDGPTQVPTIELFPSKLEFGDQSLAIPGNPQTVTLTNRTNADVKIAKIYASGDFVICSLLPTSIPAGAARAIDIRFEPKALGPASGVLTIVDDASGSPRSLLLSGAAIT